jgi:preprotein translocase subunit SecE
MDLSWLIEHSKQKRYFNKEVVDRASLIRMNVNKIVHPSKKELKVTLSDIEIIKDTFYILEMLFR